MHLNTARSIPTPKTAEGAPAARINVEAQLRRTVLSCLLWEQNFYEGGVAVADRIQDLATKVKPEVLAALAIEVREKGHLRHVPLLLLAILAKNHKGSIVGATIARVIKRADEIGEFLVIYATLNGVTPDKLKPVLSHQVRKGVAEAFHRFNEYALAKYDRDGAVTLKQALFLCHPKARTPEQDALWKRLIKGELATPDTWEVALSGGADKKEAFTRLLQEEKLGYLALLRNLRNMVQAGVDLDLVRAAILAQKGAEHVLPFRYTAAARAAPALEKELDVALCASVVMLPLMSGTTCILVDVSPSMLVKLSEKSDLTRMDAATTLASVANGEHLRVFSFSSELVEVPPRRGMAGVDAILRSQESNGTLLGKALAEVNKLPHDRLIVVTDEQSQDAVPRPVCKKAYMINVATEKNGVGYGQSGWTHIDGFSENVFRFIAECEASDVVEVRA